MEKNKTPIILIILGSLSLIPFLGVIFGIIAIVISLFSFRRFKVLFILGISGIMITFFTFLGLSIHAINMEKSGKYDTIKIQTTEMFLNNVSDEIENYKYKNGSYPDSLEQIANSNKLVLITDIFNINNTNNISGKKENSLNPKAPGNYFYKVENDTFILFSVGKDGKRFTKDDILPHDNRIKNLMAK